MKKTLMLITTLSSLWGLQACLDTASSPDDALLVKGNFPVAFVQRNLDAMGNPTDGAIYSPGGELLMKALASPSASTINITRNVEGPHDVSDPEVSYDGKTLLFSMRAPDWQNNTSWNIFEYDIRSKILSRVIEDNTLANKGDDVDPAYLPDGRIVFSSTRQTATRGKMIADNKVQPYRYKDEYERETAMVLHVLNPGLQEINQISFNQSHDRNPTVLMSGQIMFARWEHVGRRNHFPLFTADPDGTNIFVQYGAFSPGNSFLHPREMPDGRVMSSLMPLSETDEGGALMILDVRNFTDNNQPANDTATGEGQNNARPNFPAGFEREYSEFGRYTTPYPLWDGTHRALVSFKPNPRLADAQTEAGIVTGQPEPQENPPRYGIYMLDLDTDQLRPVALPPADGSYGYTDPVAVIPRNRECLISRAAGCLPKSIPDVILTSAEIQELKKRTPKTTSEKLAVRGSGILNVKSVYDTDGQNLMGNAMLVPGEKIPRKAGGVPNLRLMKNTKNPGGFYENRVARIVRIGRAVPTPPGISRQAIGESVLEMQEILGYAPIEPDGSLKVEVPADTPLTLAVLDKEGRALQTHTNWLQVRPGETRTCNGCHSPRRGSAINDPSPEGVGVHYFIKEDGKKIKGASGETMAETHTRLLFEEMEVEVPAMTLTKDIISTDEYWQPDDSRVDVLKISYEGLPTEKRPNTDGESIVINYKKHIQPLWDTHCTSCHDSAQRDGDLDLSDSVSGSGRLISYDEIMIGDPVIGTDGLPVVTIRGNGDVRVKREPPLVATGTSRQSSRSSHLMQKLYETRLRAPQDYVDGSVDHSGMLNRSELRLVAEWIDLGAQYRNDPYKEGADDPKSVAGPKKMRSELFGGLQGLDEDVFNNSVHPVLLNKCANCHQAFGNTGGTPQLNDPNPDFSGDNRFVLTGNPSGDFNVTVGMVSDVCERENNALLSWPISIGPDPGHPAINGAPVLDAASQEYDAILTWIVKAAEANGC